MFEGEFMSGSITRSGFLFFVGLLCLSPQFTFSKPGPARLPTKISLQTDEETLPIDTDSFRSGTIPAPSSGSCLLSRVQFEFSVPEGDCEPVEIFLMPSLRANQNVKLYVRFGQRVAIENDNVIADFAADSGEALERRLQLFAASNPPLRAGNYFIAISNCGSDTANFTLHLVEGILDYFMPIRIITRAEIDEKKLLVYGCFSKKGATLLLNGVPQKHTLHDADRPRGLVIGRKVSVLIAPRQTVTIQLQFADGTLSNQLLYTRPLD
jgi:hypothetical protein